MIPPITLSYPSIVDFGVGKIRSLREHLKKSQKVFMLVDPFIFPLIEPLVKMLQDQGIQLFISTHITPEPPFEVLEELLDPVREFNPDTVVGIGGGSTMDLAKLVAVLFEGKQKAKDVVGVGRIETRRVRLITAPPMLRLRRESTR